MNDKGNRIFEHVTNYGWVDSYQVYNIEKKAQFMSEVWWYIYLRS